MPRSLFLGLIIFSLFVQGSGRLFILINFKLHQAYIAKFLCENRNNAKVKCDGMCKLKKELRKDEDQAQQAQPPHINLPEPLLFPLQFSLRACCQDIRKLTTRVLPIDDDRLQRGFDTPFFRPPEQSLV